MWQVLLLLLSCGLVNIEAQNATASPDNSTAYDVSVGPINWSAVTTVRAVAQFDIDTVNVTTLNTTLISEIHNVVSQPQYKQADAGLTVTVDRVYTDTNTSTVYAYIDLQGSTTSLQAQLTYEILNSEFLNTTSYLHTTTQVLTYITALHEYCANSDNTLAPCATTQVNTTDTGVVLTVVEPVFLNSVYTGAAVILLVYSYMYIGVYRVSRPRVSAYDYETLWPAGKATTDDISIKLAQVAPAPLERTIVQPVHQPPTLYVEPLYDNNYRTSLPKHAFAEPAVPQISVDHNGRVTNRLQAYPSSNAAPDAHRHSQTPAAAVISMPPSPRGGAINHGTPVPVHAFTHMNKTIRRNSTHQSHDINTPPKLYSKRISVKQVMAESFITNKRSSVKSSTDQLHMVSRIDDDD